MNSVFLEKRNNILGKEFYTNNSGKCFVLDYKGCNSILVAFYDPFCIVECAYGQLKDGRVSNPILPNVFNKGYLGVGSYNSVTHERLYYIWRSMLDRVYNDKRHLKQPTYRDVEVCKEWLCFQNFAKWCETQEFFDAKDDKGNRYEIDKDLLIKGNKQYSPDACCFVPKIVNSLLLNAKKSRGIYPTQLGNSKQFGNSIGFKNKAFTLRASNPNGVLLCNTETKFRKLTPLECERLQTVPDNWTGCLSNTQRYKSLGNGWTIDVIAHILKCI